MERKLTAILSADVRGYSRLMSEDEAAEVLRLNPSYSLEVWRQRAPYKDPAVVERFLTARRKAGLQ